MIGVYYLPQSLGGAKIIARNYYDGSIHVSYEKPDGEFGVAEKVVSGDGTLSFLVEDVTVSLEKTPDGYTGTGVKGDVKEQLSGVIAPITDAEDRTYKCSYKKKALIMYATITKNTEKIAMAFAESFRHYGWQADLVRISNKSANMMGSYSDYDVVCLGSPIVAGSPLMCIQKRFSLGGGSSLEEDVTKNAEAGVGFNAGGVGLRGPQGGSGGPGGPGGMPGPGGPGEMPGPGGPGEMPGPGGMPEMGAPGGEAKWAGGPIAHNQHFPLGIIFTTYGGGCSGPEEANGTLALLKLYLTQKNVRVVGTFACCGKEYGPAGIDDGGKPMVMGPGKLEPPVYYKDADGNYHAGSFFFHTHMNSKPCARDIMKAKALVADIVEDYFYSHDGLRKEEVFSQYVSIS